MSVLENLVKARELIADPARWVQGSYDDMGRYCSVGALGRVTVGSAFRGCEQRDEIEALAKHVPMRDRSHAADGDLEGWVIQYNDNHTHKTVLKLWDRAIEAERQREADRADHK